MSTTLSSLLLATPPRLGPMQLMLRLAAGQTAEHIARLFGMAAGEVEFRAGARLLRWAVTGLRALVRLPVVALFGFSIWHIILYDSLLLPLVIFHHASVRLPAKLERALVPAAMRLDRASQGAVVARHHSPEDFRIKLRAHRGRSDKIDKQGGHRLATLPVLVRRDERRCARQTEPGVLRILLTTRRAGSHRQPTV